VVDPVGALGETQPATPPIARFDNRVTLLDAAAAMTSNSLRVNFLWQVNEPPPDDVTVFVHVLDANGQLIAQADGDPLAGSYPFYQWPAGLVVRDDRLIEVPGSNLTVRVGLYHRSTGERLKVTSDNNAVLADNAVPVTVH
jgi:hypothetical protein